MVTATTRWLLVAFVASCGGSRAPVPAPPAATATEAPRVRIRGHEELTGPLEVTIAGVHLTITNRGPAALSIENDFSLERPSNGRYGFAERLSCTTPTQRCTTLEPGAALHCTTIARERSAYRFAAPLCSDGGTERVVSDAFVVIGLDATAASECPEPPRARDAPVTEEIAWAIANGVAAAELCRVERSHRVRDPDVRLPLVSYETQSVPTCKRHPDCTAYAFFYEHKPPNGVTFMTWTGHGMHFSVVVERATGRTRLIPGQ